MKRLIIIVLTAFVSTAAAQTPQEEYDAWKKQARESYSRYRKQTFDDYQAFRKKANEEYAEFVKTAWAAIGRKPAVEPPEEPKPPQQPVAPDERPEPQPIPHEDVAPMPAPQPVPEVPIPVAPPTDNTVSVDYYGTEITIHTNKDIDISIEELSGEVLSAAWTALSDGRCDAMLADCLSAKKTLGIGDWGCITLLEKVAKCVTKGNSSNEAVFLQQWLLTQSGYKSRLAMTRRGVLQIYMPFDVLVFNMPYIEIDEEPYFIISKNSREDDEIKVLTAGFPEEHLTSLRVAGSPKLTYKACRRKTLRSKKYPSVTLQTEVNSNLIAYYNDYPKVSGSWDLYANASLSGEVKRSIYPKLRKMLEGKNERQKADILLNWVQTAFEYKTDEDQFGSERSLFADESLYYPYCDCEDRSILYSILIRDLVGLDVVLLHFPGHLATAVRFKTNVDGDYLELEDGRYIVCDPTYINASVGMAMPDCKKQEVRVFSLQ